MKNKTKKLKFSDFKKGEFIKKVGSHIELKIIEVGKDWRSGKKFITFYDDVMGYSTTIVDLSNYIKV